MREREQSPREAPKLKLPLRRRLRGYFAGVGSIGEGQASLMQGLADLNPFPSEGRIDHRKARELRLKRIEERRRARQERARKYRVSPKKSSS